MKKQLLSFFLLLPNMVFASADCIFNNKTWYIDNNTLNTTSHTPFTLDGKVYDYSINYIIPSGMRSSSNACALSSPTSLICRTGDSVSLNLDTHTAILTTHAGGTYTYYEKDYASEKSPLSGTWKREQTGGSCRNDLATMVVPHQPRNATTFEHVNTSSEHGSSGSHTYHLVKGSLGKIAFSPTADKAYFNSYYLYDANNNPVYDMNQISVQLKLNDSSNKFDERCNLIKSS